MCAPAPEYLVYKLLQLVEGDTHTTPTKGAARIRTWASLVAAKVTYQLVHSADSTSRCTQHTLSELLHLCGIAIESRTCRGVSAAVCTKASDGIRTHDLSPKAMLSQLSYTRVNFSMNRKGFYQFLPRLTTINLFVFIYLLFFQPFYQPRRYK